MDDASKFRYESIAQRVVYSRVGVMPPFLPLDSVEVSYESQRQMYSFLRDVSTTLLEDPGRIGLQQKPDDSYGDWDLQRSKPDLAVTLRSLRRRVDAFYLLLMEIGKVGTLREDCLFVPSGILRIPAGRLAVLKTTGISSRAEPDGVVLTSVRYPDLFPAWKMLSQSAGTRKQKVNQDAAFGEQSYSLLVFTHAAFDPSQPLALEIFHRMIGACPPLERLERYLSSQGYHYVDTWGNEMSMDWYKDYGKKPEPLKAYWAEKTHGGFSIEYDYMRQRPFCFALRIPRFKDILARFDEMEGELQSFVLRQAKKCDGCGYCTQTDKSGTRARQWAEVRKGDTAASVCLMFPGFYFRWRSLDEARAADIIRFLAFIDRLH